jgi:hypothetical protein
METLRLASALLSAQPRTMVDNFDCVNRLRQDMRGAHFSTIARRRRKVRHYACTTTLPC